MASLIKFNKLKIGISGIFLASVLTVLTPLAVAAPAEQYLIPMGNAVGISLQTDGVMVVGVPDVLKDGSTVSPARDAGMSPGDIITQINSSPVSSGSDLKSALEKLDGSPVSLTVRRGSKTLEVSVTPHRSSEGKFELGLWMRDGISGIGTLTFYDPETKTFGALGHSINDVETGIIIPLREGAVTRSTVTDVVPGKAGTPGQLHGEINPDEVIGSLTINSRCGIFGSMADNTLTQGKKALPSALDSEIKLGPATILTNVSGSDVTEYGIEITRLYTGEEANGRSMMISVTDPKLIEKTGGIVQGMSGSPIIQNGKIIGAVTHVLINDPTKGYGIAIGKMLDTIRNNQSASYLAA